MLYVTQLKNEAWFNSPINFRNSVGCHVFIIINNAEVNIFVHRGLLSPFLLGSTVKRHRVQLTYRWAYRFTRVSPGLDLKYMLTQYTESYYIKCTFLITKWDGAFSSPQLCSLTKFHLALLLIIWPCIYMDHCFIIFRRFLCKNL